MTFTRRHVAAGLGVAVAGCTLGPDTSAAPPRIFFLGNAKVFVIDPAGGEAATLVDQTQKDGARRGINDGVAIDHARGHIYWSNMGRAAENDGYIQRCDLDGRNVRMIVPPGGAFTPKQVKLHDGHIYWSDREGMAVMRCRLDGSGVETLVRTGDPAAHKGEEARWCVGVGVNDGWLYWTQKGGDNAGEGAIRRVSLAMRSGETPDQRMGVETLYANLPEPIGIEFHDGALYWTDRGDNTVNRSRLDGRREREILVRNAGEAIGVAIDPAGKRMAYSSLGGELWLADIDGRNPRRLVTGGGGLTGVAWG